MKMKRTYKSLENYLDGLREQYTAAVDSIIKTATEASEDGAYDVNFDQIDGDFDMLEDRYLIAEMLCEREEVIEAEAHGYGFDLTLRPEYCQRMTADAESIPDSHIESPYAVDLIASYENLLPVREQERLTRYWGEYGGYVKKHGVADGQFREAYAEALQAIGMSSEAYHDRRFVYRGELEVHMRGCMLAKTLRPGDEIVFVPPSPTGDSGGWQYEAGLVAEVDTAAKACVVSVEDGEATIPLRYVLARFRDQSYEGDAFGFEHAEPVFGMPESRAEHFLWEARHEYEKQHPELTASEDDESPGMTLT
jgi:hypothetical protein